MKLNYKYRESRRSRYMRLSVSHEGVLVTVPVGCEESRVERFVREREEWIEKKLVYFRKFTVVNVPKGYGPRHFAKHKMEALCLVKERLEVLNRKYGFRYKRIMIRNTKTRWGSCSRQGNLSFSYKILFLPPEIRDYIVAHELCHLGEFNHSKNFWALVARTVPHYRPICTRLRHLHISFS